MLASSREPCRHREALRGVEDAAPYKLQGKHCRESPGDVTGPAIMRRGGIHPARGTLPCREPLRASNARPYNRWKNAAAPQMPAPSQTGRIWNPPLHGTRFVLRYRASRWHCRGRCSHRPGGATTGFFCVKGYTKGRAYWLCLTLFSVPFHHPEGPVRLRAIRIADRACIDSASIVEKRNPLNAKQHSAAPKNNL